MDAVTQPFAAYVRVSKLGDRSVEDLRSTELQRQAIRTFAERNSLEIVWTTDDIDSKGSTTERKVLEQIVQDIEGGQLGGLVVYKLDRLSRLAPRARVELFDRIEAAGGRVLSTLEPLDPATPQGRFTRELFLSVARMEWESRRDEFARATRLAVERGVHTATAPFGYAKGPDRVLVVVEPEAVVVRGCFERRARGMSWSELARWADSTGVPPRHGTRWTRSTISRIVSNRAYLGEAWSGAIVNPDAHPAIVDVEAFEAAQIARGVRPARGEPALLSGLVRCAGCRHRMHPGTVGGQRKQLVYRCRGRHGAGVCPAPSNITRAHLDQIVVEQFLAHFSDVAVQGRAGGAPLTEATDALAAAERGLDAYLEAVDVEIVGDRAFKAGYTKRAAVVEDARAALHRARSQAAGLNLGVHRLDAALWGELPMDAHRRLLTAGLDTVFVRRAEVVGRNQLDPDRVRIYWRGEAPEALPGPGIRVPLAPLDW